MTQDMLMTLLGTLLVGIGGYIAACLKELTHSIQELNVKMAVVISQLSNHEDRLSRLEE